jgi:hypothetical protein
MRDAILKEASRVEEDALYSSKAHYNASGRWSRVHFWMGLAAALLSAIAGVSALKQHPELGGVLALLVAVLSGIATFINAERRSSAHHVAAASYQELRNQARIFREVTAEGTSEEVALARGLRQLTDRRDGLNRGSPQIPTWAFKKARAGIEGGEASYAVDRPSPRSSP